MLIVSRESRLTNQSFFVDAFAEFLGGHGLENVNPPLESMQHHGWLHELHHLNLDTSSTGVLRQ